MGTAWSAYGMMVVSVMVVMVVMMPLLLLLVAVVQQPVLSAAALMIVGHCGRCCCQAGDGPGFVHVLVVVVQGLGGSLAAQRAARGSMGGRTLAMIRCLMRCRSC